MLGRRGIRIAPAREVSAPIRASEPASGNLRRRARFGRPRPPGPSHRVVLTQRVTWSSSRLASDECDGVPSQIVNRMAPFLGGRSPPHRTRPVDVTRRLTTDALSNMERGFQTAGSRSLHTVYEYSGIASVSSTLAAALLPHNGNEPRKGSLSGHSQTRTWPLVRTARCQASPPNSVKLGGASSTVRARASAPRNQTLLDKSPRFRVSRKRVFIFVYDIRNAESLRSEEWIHHDDLTATTRRDYRRRPA